MMIEPSAFPKAKCPVSYPRSVPTIQFEYAPALQTLASSPHMPSYRFAIHCGMTETEMLGFMKLRDDAEAFDFAKRIIQDMPDEGRTQGDGCSVGITDGEREVGGISCDADFEA
jgi:hypothetical protein